MAFIIKQLAEHGTTNPIVARLSLQGLDILKRCNAPEEVKNCVGELLLHTLQPKLLRCWEISQRFQAEFSEKVSSYTPPEKIGNACEVPQIPRLVEECHNYLYEAKNYLRGVLQVINAFYGTSFEEPSEFEKRRNPRPSVVEWAANTFGTGDSRTAFFEEAAKGVMELIWARNAVEHPGGYSGNLVIKNFEAAPDFRISEPHWYREKDGLIQADLGSIGGLMAISVQNLLVIGEDTIASWADRNLENPDIFQLRMIQEADRDQSCPVKWTVDVNPELLAKMS